MKAVRFNLFPSEGFQDIKNTNDDYNEEGFYQEVDRIILEWKKTKKVREIFISADQISKFRLVSSNLQSFQAPNKPPSFRQSATKFRFALREKANRVDPLSPSVKHAYKDKIFFLLCKPPSPSKLSYIVPALGYKGPTVQELVSAHRIPVKSKMVLFPAANFPPRNVTVAFTMESKGEIDAQLQYMRNSHANAPLLRWSPSGNPPRAPEFVSSSITSVDESFSFALVICVGQEVSSAIMPPKGPLVEVTLPMGFGFVGRVRLCKFTAKVKSIVKWFPAPGLPRADIWSERGEGRASPKPRALMGPVLKEINYCHQKPNKFREVAFKPQRYCSAIAFLDPPRCVTRRNPENFASTRSAAVFPRISVSASWFPPEFDAFLAPNAPPKAFSRSQMFASPTESVHPGFWVKIPAFSFLELKRTSSFGLNEMNSRLPLNEQQQQHQQSKKILELLSNQKLMLDGDEDEYAQVNDFATSLESINALTSPATSYISPTTPHITKLVRPTRRRSYGTPMFSLDLQHVVAETPVENGEDAESPYEFHTSPESDAQSHAVPEPEPEPAPIVLESLIEPTSATCNEQSVQDSPVSSNKKDAGDEVHFLKEKTVIVDGQREDDKNVSRIERFDPESLRIEVRNTAQKCNKAAKKMPTEVKFPITKTVVDEEANWIELFFHPFLHMMVAESGSIQKFVQQTDEEATLWAVFQIYGKCESLVATTIRVNQAVKALRDAKIAGSQFLSTTQLDLLIRQLPASDRPLESDDAKGSRLVRDSDSVMSRRSNASSGREVAKKKVSFDSSASNLSFRKFKSVVSMLLEVIEKNNAGRKSKDSGDRMRGRSFVLKQLKRLLSDLTVKYRKEHKLDFQKLYEDSKVCISEITRPHGCASSPAREFEYCNGNENSRLESPSTLSSLSESTRMAPSSSSESKRVRREIIDGDDAIDRSGSVRQLWEWNTDQIRQIYGFYATSHETRKFGLGAGKTMMSVENVRDFLTDFGIMPHYIDLQSILRTFRSCKLWEWYVVSQILENSEAGKAPIDLISPRTECSQGFHISAAHQHKATSIAAEAFRALGGLRSPNKEGLTEFQLLEQQHDFGAVVGNLSLSISGFIELLTRVAVNGGKLGKDARTAVESLLHIMNESNGKAKQTNAFRKSSIDVRNFVFS